jgi:sn-glycerol 3-phosphate transport system permease protein
LNGDKKVIFKSRWLPWVLIAPQAIIILAFFFWPAAQALIQSFQQSDVFGTSVEWNGIENFASLWRDETYLESFKTTAIFSILVAGLGISLSLLLAFFADRITKGAWFYRTLLILPYAVAPVVAGVLWLFLFSPSVGLASYMLE